MIEIFLDGESMLQFECGQGVPALQRRQLDELDFRMDEGFHLLGSFVESPDAGQRVHFVVGLLLRALERDDQSTVTGLCTYLANRVPTLAVVRAITISGGAVDVGLVYR